MINNDIYLQEFIGNYIEVISSSNNNNIGLHGYVVDETKNTLIIDHSGKQKVVPKAYSKFRIWISGNPYDLEGSLIIMKPEDRTKEKRRYLKN
ncbi:ribonuclease P protein component 1 [Acidiplasma cupricumulans]|uniref:ribonuclease P protein component 1 n=1 Tax=Acidiplasma cupricumulans TaxID=312540 RepID=UPI0007849388|nr:ribonuclease P protein component 1 [Acidiplasma cupricumulans]